jgi:hypothetical protein
LKVSFFSFFFILPIQTVHDASAQPQSSASIIVINLKTVSLPGDFGKGMTKMRMKWEDSYPIELTGVISEERFAAMMQRVNELHDNFVDCKVSVFCGFGFFKISRIGLFAMLTSDVVLLVSVNFY